MMRDPAIAYVIGELIAGAIVLTLAIIWDAKHHDKQRKQRGPWDK